MRLNRTHFVFSVVLAALVVFGADLSTASEMAAVRPLISGRQTLRQVQAFALANNPEVSAGAFDRQAAQARSEGAFGARLPRLTIEGAYSRYDPDLRLTAARYNGELGVFGNNILTTDLVLRLPLFTGGRLVAEVRAAELLEASADQRLARSRGDLLYNVASLYFSILAQQRLIASLELSGEALAAHLTQVQALIAGRKAAAVDGLRSEVKLADIHQRLSREQNVLAIQRQSLLNLLGAGGAAANFSLADEMETPVAERASVATLVETAVQKRPDVIAVRHETDAQAARLEAARAGHWPTVNFVGAVGSRIMNNPAQQPVGHSNNDHVSRVGVTLEIPIFEGGRTAARVDEEHAKLNAQRERLNKLLLQVSLEVASASANLASARDRLTSTDKAITLAKKVFDIEREKYLLARGTLLDVLDAQSALLDAEATQIRALADANTARAQLLWAMGEAEQ